MSDQQREVLEMDDVLTSTERTRLTPSHRNKPVTIESQDGLQSQQDHLESSRSESLYFEDGLRKIDYVLAFAVGSDKEDVIMKKIAKRSEFEANLEKAGLQLEYEKAEKSPDGKTCFVKIHAPWELLTTQAELMKLKMPIKKMDKSEKPIYSDYLDRLFSKCPFALDKEIMEEQDYFTAVFSRQMEEQFIIEDRDTFFSNAQRSRMVYDILIRTNYDANYAQRFGINRLIKNGTYLAAYPLHDLNLHTKTDRISSKTSPRQILYQYWAKPTMFYKFQPLDLVRNYFGEKIAIYFAWLGFYTKALLPAAVVGVFCLVYGAATLAYDIPSLDICNKTGAGSILMCPNCDYDCKTWNLSQSCSYSKVTHLFDNWFTVFFAICMSIWATLFLEGWKRSQSTLAWDWDISDFELEEESIRPEFQTRVKTKAKNPITEEEEPYLPFKQRVTRLIASGVTVFFFLCLVVAFVFGVIVYRVIVEFLLNKNEDVMLRSNAQIITAVTAATLNLICIIILDYVYQSLAWKLTDWEFPRTQAQFEDSYTFKVFMFQFINYNSSLFYIAFFKGKFATVPHWQQNYLFGIYPPERCDPAGCMVELLIQLGIIMVGKQFVGNCLEILFPILWNKLRSCCGRKSWASGDYTRWEKDYDLNAVPQMHLFDEYLEMVIQFGFVTLFVAAFPLAPLFALINNIMEIRLDAYKFIVAYRRPMPARAQGLGVWYEILDGVSKFAVLTNACVIAFTSDFVPRLVYRVAYSTDYSLAGYINSEMAYFDPSEWCSKGDNRNRQSDFCKEPFCRFPDYRNSPCNFTRTYNMTVDPVCGCDADGKYSVCIKWWHVLAARLAFILVFEHLVFMVKGIVAYLIPDTPHEVLVQIRKENYLAKQAFYQHEFERHLAENRGDKNADPKTGGDKVMFDRLISNSQSVRNSARDSEYYTFYTPTQSISSLAMNDGNDNKT